MAKYPMGEVKKDRISCLKMASIPVILVWYHFFVQAPSFRRGSEQPLGFGPHLLEQFGVPVPFQICLGIPMAVGEKDAGIVPVLVQFQMAAALKMCYQFPGLPKKLFKTSYIFLFKGQFYDPYQHLDKVYGDGVPIIQPQEGGGAPNGVQVALVNGQLYIIGGVEEGKQVARTFPLVFFQVKIDNITVLMVYFHQFFVPGP
jgi:hypothetical protein